MRFTVLPEGSPQWALSWAQPRQLPGERCKVPSHSNLLPHTQAACLALQRRLHLENSWAHILYGILSYFKLVYLKTVVFFLHFWLWFVPETFRVKTVLQLNVIFHSPDPYFKFHFSNLRKVKQQMHNIQVKCKGMLERGPWGKYRNALLPRSNAATFYVPPNSWLQKLLQTQLSCTAWGISERDHPGGC